MLSRRKQGGAPSALPAITGGDVMADRKQELEALRELGLKMTSSPSATGTGSPGIGRIMPWLVGCCRASVVASWACVATVRS